MKRFIITLLVSLFVIGCAFGADAGSASITLKANIAIKEPTFRLSITDGDVETPVSAIVGTSDNTAEATLTKDLTEEAASVNFAIEQISDAKMVGGYTITATATDFVLSSTASELGLTDAELASISEDNKKFAVTSTTPAITKHADYATSALGFATFSATGNVLTVRYLGVLKASDTSPVELGTFSCGWDKNENAINGNYTSTITIAVETV